MCAWEMLYDMLPLLLFCPTFIIHKPVITLAAEHTRCLQIIDLTWLSVRIAAISTGKWPDKYVSPTISSPPKSKTHFFFFFLAG